eukprot:9053396-Ditylum_brightwellii.AAC.1
MSDCSGASVGELVILNIDSLGPTILSSSIPDSYNVWNKCSLIENDVLSAACKQVLTALEALDELSVPP